MKKLDKKYVIISIVVALLIVATVTVSSYAYFSISNKEGAENVITSGTMSLLFTDSNAITASNLLPGQSIEKEFSVKNNGNVNTTYDVYLSEVINTFVDKTDLVYEITSADGGYQTSNPTQVKAPSASTKIVSDYSIGVGVTHHYTLKITFLNKNEAQDDNQGKEFKATIQINEYKDVETTVNYYLDNVQVNTMPDNTYNYLSFSCDKNASLSFDTTNWEYELININQNHTTCNIYFEIPSYTLTYDYNYDGSTPTTTSIKLGQPYGSLPEPQRSGFSFVGWYTSSSGGEAVSSNDIIDGDVRIYAHWEDATLTFVPASENDKFLGIVYMDPTNTSVKCTESISSSENLKKDGCMKWYVFDSDEDNYQMILDHNATNAILYTNLNSTLNDLINNYNWQYTPQIISAYDIAKITNYTNWNKTEWFYLDTNNRNAPSFSSTNRSKYYWLFDNLSDCYSHGCKTELASTATYSEGYWTSTSYSSYAWTVEKYGTLDNNNGSFSIRPYITVPKSLFE